MENVKYVKILLNISSALCFSRARLGRVLTMGEDGGSYLLWGARGGIAWAAAVTTRNAPRQKELYRWVPIR